MPDAVHWACRLSACLPSLAHGATSVLPSLTDLANQYFNHLGLPLISVAQANNHDGEVLDLSGGHTPDSDVSYELADDRVGAVNSLLSEANQKQNEALKLLVRVVLFMEPPSSLLWCRCNCATCQRAP